MPETPSKRPEPGATRALEESAARFAALADESTEGIAVHEAGRIVVAGRALEAMCGYGPGELVGRPVVDLIAPEARAAALQAIAERAEVPREYTGLRRDGSTFPVRVTVRNLTHLGAPVRFALVRDLSAEHAALAAHASSERRWRSLAALVPVCVFETDAKGDCLFVNERWQETAGLSLEQAKGRGWLEAIHPDDREHVNREWYAAASAGREFNLEYRFQTPAGHVTWVEGRARALDRDGAVAGYLGTATDVTTRRDAEARSSLRERLTAVGRLAAGVAHEINSPLHYVTANVELLLEDLATAGRETSTARMRESLEQVRLGAEQIRTVVLGLSTLSRPSEDRRVVLNVRPLLERAVASVLGTDESAIRVICQLDDVPLVCAGDAALSQAFTSLLRNAAEAVAGAGRRGQIEIISRTDAEGRAVVEVRDNGVGIADEHVHRIFEPFFTTKTRGEGVGLGLWVAHGVITSIGGTIDARSALGEGTTMTVSLPPAIARAGVAEEAAVPAGVRGKVLVIDDDALVGKSVRRVLHERHDVTCLTDAREALALLHAGTAFDVILCDLMMPNMTGQEFFEAIERELPAERGKVLFMSGGTFLDGIQAFLTRAGVPCLTKPVPAPTLRAAIHSAIGKARDV